MNLAAWLLDFVLHVDKYLDRIIQDYGTGTYVLLFCVVFCETGLVVTPFLPGDSLLFAVGAFAARGSLDLTTSLVVLTSASILGDSTNYWIGRWVGPAVFHREDSRFFRKEHLDRTHRFYEKYGTKTIVMARFVPIVRTFSPFVAGIGRMAYPRFLTYSVLGGATWVGLFVLGGYWFGNIEVIKRNFTFVILAIIVLSLSPIAIEYVRHRRRSEAR